MYVHFPRLALIALFAYITHGKSSLFVFFLWQLQEIVCKGPSTMRLRPTSLIIKCVSLWVLIDLTLAHKHWKLIVKRKHVKKDIVQMNNVQNDDPETNQI